jgi:dihydropteroate synthase
MFIERVTTPEAKRDMLKQLGVEPGGEKILAQKMTHYLFLIRDLHVGAANILKQDALSVGADLAVPKGTILAETPTVDALLIATGRQLEALSRKELAQPFGLKQLAKTLALHLASHQPGTPKIMGVINANDDSFFEGSRFKGDAAIAQIHQQIRDGAEIVDIGGISTRPGSAKVPASKELARVRPIIDRLYADKTYEQVRLSIDSFTPEVIAYALERGFTIVNDITGLSNPVVAKLAGEYDATVVIMHMQGTPQTMQNDPHYTNLLSDISHFFEERIALAEQFGIRDLILDVGIGFGKTLEHNLQLMANMEHFLYLGKPLLIGASRKSMIDKIIPTPTQERLPGTLALHLHAIEKGAEIVRTHDVKAHKQALAVQQALRGTTY